MAKRRPPDPAGGITQRHLRLGVALLRADALSQLIASSGPDVPSREGGQAQQLVREITEVKVGPVSRWFSYLQVYFASVQILIETLNQTKLTNPTIKALLSDNTKRKLLREFRDELLHGGSLLGEGPQTFFDDLGPMDQWAFELREACDRLVVEYFARDDVKARMTRKK
jgi:hypothetical protein